MLECVVNVSEGRDRAVLDRLAAAAGTSLLDLHRDPHHHRSVLTLAGADDGLLEEAVRRVAVATLEAIDLGRHDGVHPRLGALDVVPFVPLAGTGRPAAGGDDLGRALHARDRFARWAGTELGLPCFLYGPERSLPDVRRHAFDTLAPDTGPPAPHPWGGACAVGARPALAAWNLWVDGIDVAGARQVAAAARRDGLRTLGLDVGGRRQISCNLVDPYRLGPAQAYDLLAPLVAEAGGTVAGAELVGLLPAGVLDLTPEDRWVQLDLGRDRTVESRMASRPD